MDFREPRSTWALITEPHELRATTFELPSLDSPVQVEIEVKDSVYRAAARIYSDDATWLVEAAHSLLAAGAIVADAQGLTLADELRDLTILRDLDDLLGWWRAVESDANNTEPEELTWEDFCWELRGDPPAPPADAI